MGRGVDPAPSQRNSRNLQEEVTVDGLTGNNLSFVAVNG
jgi:hypothetical protein